MVGRRQQVVEEIFGVEGVAGLARELVHRVQRMRRDNGLALSDRIRLAVGAALAEHRDYICGETLCCALDFDADVAGEAYKINGEEVVLRLSRVD